MLTGVFLAFGDFLYFGDKLRTDAGKLIIEGDRITGSHGFLKSFLLLTGDKGAFTISRAFI